MNVLRRMGIWLCGGLFALSVSYILFYSVISTTALDNNTVKGWLRSSDAYAKFANDVIAPTIKSSYQSQSQANSFITSDMIQTASEASVTPAFVKQTAETQLDAFYGWMNGKTKDAPQFSIPLQNVQDNFFGSLKQQILAKVTALPACYAGQQALDLSGNVLCLPAGVNAQELTDQLTASFKDSSTLFSKPVSGSDFSNGQTQTTPQSAPSNAQPAASNSLPTYIAWLHSLYPVVWVSAVLLAIALVFLASSRWRGLVNVGWHIFSPALLFVVAGLIAVLLGPRLDLSTIVSGSQTGLVALLQSLLKTIITSVGQHSLLAGGAAVVVALLLIGGGYLWKRRTRPAPPSQESTPSSTPPTPPTPEPPVSPQAPTPSARPRPPLIQ